jgi:hypothetical protein
VAGGGAAGEDLEQRPSIEGHRRILAALVPHGKVSSGEIHLCP